MFVRVFLPRKEQGGETFPIAAERKLSQGTGIGVKIFRYSHKYTRAS